MDPETAVPARRKTPTGWLAFFATTSLLTVAFETCVIADYAIVWIEYKLPLAFYFIITHIVTLIFGLFAIIYMKIYGIPPSLILIIDFCLRVLLIAFSIFIYSVMSKGWLWDILICILIPLIRGAALAHYNVKYDF